MTRTDPVSAIIRQLAPLESLGFKLFASPAKVDNPAILNSSRAVIVQHYEDFPGNVFNDFSNVQQQVESRFRTLVKIHKCSSEQAWAVRSAIHSLLVGFKPDAINALRLLRWVVEDYSNSSAEFNWLGEFGFSSVIVAQPIEESLPLLKEIFLIETVNDDELPGQYELIPGIEP